MTDRQQYPLSTPDGEPIPLEIIRPLGYIRQTFTGEASPLVAIPVSAGFLILRASADCYVRFLAAAVIPVDGVHVTDQLVLELGEMLVVDHASAANFSVIAIAGDGVLHVQTCVRYTDVRKSAQQDRM